MILAMHQPNFLPWIGFFHKMACADVFVLLDNVQVPRGGSYANRTRIKTPGGVQWLTMPVHKGDSLSYAETTISGGNWFPGLWRKVEHNYARAEYFDEYAIWVESLLEAVRGQSLAVGNIAMIMWARIALDLHAEVVIQSMTGIHTGRETLAADLCKALGCNVYLSGQGAEAYNGPQVFAEREIELRYDSFPRFVYAQPWGAFIPDLSIIDLLFNCGRFAEQVLMETDSI